LKSIWNSINILNYTRLFQTVLDYYGINFQKVFDNSSFFSMSEISLACETDKTLK